ncbi:MAG TPA: AraC family transcriptional regulator [Roseibacterium sp.]|nr:AraC family transcriptional regulator [Roseibacterium sp.]
MVFVPLPLFATLLLAIVLVRFVVTHDMRQRAHQLFAALVALYVVQSLLLSLRWGYGLDSAAWLTVVIAPVLPVIAYLAFAALSAPLRARRLWPALAIGVNWLILVAVPQGADLGILVTYIGFGGALVWLARKGPDQLALSPLDNARGIAVAMGLTGLTLVASGLTDIYVLVDFIRNDGRNVGLIVSFVQTAFVLVIGLAAGYGRASVDTSVVPAPRKSEAVLSGDSEIISRLEALFEKEGLHKSEELSLRRMARRLHLPDRRISNAINRSRGVSVSQFVNQARIRDACVLLATGEDTILSVSLAAGFATKSNFNREFLRVMGVTPSAWRENNLGAAVLDGR